MFYYVKFIINLQPLKSQLKSQTKQCLANNPVFIHKSSEFSICQEALRSFKQSLIADSITEGGSGTVKHFKKMITYS